MPKKKSSKNKSKKKSSTMLSFWIIIFMILAILALAIILNKGTIAGYSLVKIETSTDSNTEKTVEEPENKMEISLEKKYLSMKKKETSEISITINGEKVDIDEVELSLSNEDVVKIKDGIITAVSVGKTTITATKDDLEATADLRVIIPITSMTFSTTNSTVRVGKSLQMKLVAKPSDANIETLKYESSNEKIATVNSNGIVTGIAPGTVTITVTDRYSELTKSVKLTIRK